MLRTGIVVSYSNVKCSGIIVDCNNQEIAFFNKNADCIFSRHDIVRYRIAQTETGLQAINTVIVFDLSGQSVNLALV